MRYLLGIACLLIASTAIAAPTVVDSEYNVYFSAGTDTTLDVAVPTHTPGDLMIAYGFAGGAFTNDLTPPDGWTAIVDDDENTLASVDTNAYIWYKVAGGSEGSDYTFGMANAFVLTKIVVVSINGAADPGDIAIVSAIDTETGAASGSPVAPSVTATHDDSLILRYIATRYDGGSYMQPGSHSLVFNNGTTWATAGVASITGNTGASGTATWTNAQSWQTGYWMSSLAIAPPSGGGSAVPVITSQYNGPDPLVQVVE